ncbi:MAG: phospho-N-acetylmuramoyl-pentapeptide-transferase [Alphaproteobacteria bacterium]|nr:phospho-N-acetylmuramoyl-pentapeptide-transferase [Alphaproteobacteria bacterium]MDA7982726.1 phospho-N-acetylmuramoyl-pentapeptide-transferase [Alphaproteobacteria bacterium]MDA7984121.1 phospho-N-acetylmuramoyl-pentapeptide-transferase [Alphaproteobacteria bacterium]MDA7986982.1 phospho-N-acetylmuramoyl-pentapeptide-transferase [Alphaproteobacteria bacterium]MDA7988171.1 phospho-N-acetylmuramoyl-pentapeptide-transferase [Alphaproteobacteria bacterium]
MLYHLFTSLADSVSVFNVFRYLSFRSGLAILTALVISFAVGDRLILWLKNKQGNGQPIREDGPETHLRSKRGTPTMGGALILLSLGSATLLWADLTNPYIWIAIAVTLSFGAIGLLDDYLKVTRAHAGQGVPGRLRLSVEAVIVIVAAVAVAVIGPDELAYTLAFPVFKNALLYLGPVLFAAFAIPVVAGAANAVNLTDGLDGLAIVPVMIAAACFAAIAYLTGNAVFAEYLQIHYVSGAGELAVLCSALVGASLGFLWFNAPPAMIFMGDTGALACGALLGTVAVITRHEIVLAIIGGLFVAEALSVMIQVLWFKKTGNRIFLMAPFHHHFEKKGWSEPKIVIRFWIIAVICALAGLSTLKLR